MWRRPKHALLLEIPLLFSLVAASGAAQSSRPAEIEGKALFSALEGPLEQPRLAADSQGTLFLLFVRDRRELYLATLPTGPGTWTPPHLIARTPLLAVGLRRGPRLAVTDRALLVSWIESRFDPRARRSKGSRNLVLIRSTDRGRTWSKPATINEKPASAGEGLHDMAATPDGKVALVWLDHRGEGARLYGALSEDHGRSFEGDRLLYASPSGSICPCCHPSVAFDRNGLARAVWRNAVHGNRDLYTGVLVGSGRLIRVTRLGLEHWHLLACPMDGGDLAFAQDGRLLAIWRRADSIYLTRGQDPEQRLGRGRQPVLARAAGRTLLVWQQGRSLTGRLVTEGRSKALRLGRGAFAVACGVGEGLHVVAERHQGGSDRLVHWTF